MSASSSNSPRASMIAVPCSPIVPDSRMRSPGRIESAASRARGSRSPTPAVQMYIPSAAPRSTTLVSPPTMSHLRGVRGRRDRLDLGLQVVRREPLLEDQRERERARARARHGEVVHGPVDGEVADRAAREAERLDHERVGGERQRGAADLERRGVLRRLSAEGRLEQPLDHALGRLAAGAVRHVHPLGAELAALRARGLDDLEDALLLAPGDAHTTSRSRAKRPKL